MKEKLKKIVQFLINPRLLVCIFIAWLITNGWPYILLALGTYLHSSWMIGVSSAYLAFLWLPVSPEKIVTFAIAIALMRWIFPNDEKTLAVLRELLKKAKYAIKNRRENKEEPDYNKIDKE